MSKFTETTEELQQILLDDIESFESGAWEPDADSIEAFGEVAAEVARREATEGQLYILTKEDVESVIGDRKLKPEQSEACYNAVRDMDSSAIFETIEVLVDFILKDM